MIVKNNYWLTNDPMAKEHVYNSLSNYNEAMLRQIIFDNELKQQAISLIKLLKKEYHLE